jgi:hypothetical protein
MLCGRPRPSSYGGESRPIFSRVQSWPAAFGGSQHLDALWPGQDLVSLGSNLGSATFGAGQDLFLWGWWDPVLLGSGRDPIAFGMAKAQLPLEQPRPSSFGQSRHNFFEGWS